MSNLESRRDFLKHGLMGTAAAGVALTGLQKGHAQEDVTNPRVERRVLGRTGAEVSIIGLGLGSAFTNSHQDDPDATDIILDEALAYGINYWDTARSYGPSEEMIGSVVKANRSEIFLVSKSGNRTYDGFMSDLETSLKNLQTDHIDLYHIHSLDPREDTNLDSIENGAVKAAREAKKQGIIRNWGITGHSGPDILMSAIKQWDPDCIMTTFPCTRPDNGRYEDELLPLAVSRKMGVVAMKMVRRARDADLTGTNLIRYAISLPGVAVANVGLDTSAHLTDNARMATDFTPLATSDLIAMHQKVTPRLTHSVDPWTIPGYVDGTMA